MAKTWTWVLGLGLVACAPITKNGGDIDDTESGSSDGGEDEGGSAGPACNAEPVCGDGVIQALEECDGAEGCQACVGGSGWDPIGGSEEIGAIAFADDGSWLVATIVAGGDPFVRRFDAAGIELWSHALVDIAHAPLGVALDGSGRAYVAGATRDETGNVHSPWTSSWDPDGHALFIIQDGDRGAFGAVAATAERIALVGSQYSEQDEVSLIRVLDGSGEEQWSLGDDSLDGIMDVALVGSDLVVTGRRDIAGEPQKLELRRYDELATARWSLDLPTDAAEPFHLFRVTGDGGDGTWTFGTHNLSPYVVHHDAEGAELERLDCFGSESSHLLSLAVHEDGRLALGIEYALGEVSPLELRAWFPIVQDGEVVSATAPGVDTTPEGVAWRGDRALVAWTDTVSRHSTLSLRP